MCKLGVRRNPIRRWEGFAARGGQAMRNNGHLLFSSSVGSTFLSGIACHGNIRWGALELRDLADNGTMAQWSRSLRFTSRAASGPETRVGRRPLGPGEKNQLLHLLLKFGSLASRWDLMAQK